MCVKTRGERQSRRHANVHLDDEPSATQVFPFPSAPLAGIASILAVSFSNELDASSAKSQIVAAQFAKLTSDM